MEGRDDIAPMLEVHLELAGREICVAPSSTAMRALAYGWVESLFQASLLVKRLDADEGEGWDCETLMGGSCQGTSKCA